jgi:hypothetical protein
VAAGETQGFLRDRLWNWKGEIRMNLSRPPSPRLGVGVLGSRKRGGLGSAKGIKGAGSGSFLQEAVSGVFIAMPLQFSELLLLQGKHGVHLQQGQGRACAWRWPHLAAQLPIHPSPHHVSTVPYLHHSMADSPIGLLSAQEQHRKDDEGASSRSHDQQTRHSLPGYPCPSWCLWGEDMEPRASLRFTRLLCGFGDHSLDTDL